MTIQEAYKLWQSAKTVFIEDDAFPPDAEEVHQAWERLYNQKFNDRQAIHKFDGGDHSIEIHSNNRLLWMTWRGECEIREY